MAIIRWTPERDLPLGLFNLPTQLNRMMNRFMTGLPEEDLLGSFPPVDIVEHDNEYVVKAEVPGIRPEDLKITVSNNVLTIRGERIQEEEERNPQYHRMERSTGSFQRSFTLPFPVDPDEVKANCDNGILRVTVPKTEEYSPREINIGSGGQTGFQPQIERGQSSQEFQGSRGQQANRGESKGRSTSGTSRSKTTGRKR